MKKYLLIAALGVFGLAANAESYSTVSVSYDNTQLFANEEEILSAITLEDGKTTSLNGFGLQYNYGIGLGNLPMNVEVGLKWSMGFKTAKESFQVYGEEGEIKAATTMMRLGIPVSYIYHFNCGDNFRISPYAGLDFRFNLLASTKNTFTVDGESESETTNWFKKDDVDTTAKRFQMGWHVGLRFEYSKVFLGVEYGTDFLPFWSIKEGNYKAHINTGNLAVSVGYKF